MAYRRGFAEKWSVREMLRKSVVYAGALKQKRSEAAMTFTKADRKFLHAVGIRPPAEEAPDKDTMRSRVPSFEEIRERVQQDQTNRERLQEFFDFDR
jgi:hypothetical protein